MLIMHGIRVDAKNTDGLTASDVASAAEYGVVVDAISQVESEFVA